MDFTDDPEVRDQLLIGGNSRFSRKCNDSVTIWRPAIHGKSPPRRRTCQKAQRKDAQSAPLPVLENFCPRNTRMTRNEASAAGGSETSSTDRRRYFFLNFASFRCLPAVAGVSEGPILSRVPALLAKARSQSSFCKARWNGRRGDSSTRWSRNRGTALPPDIRTFDDSLAIDPSRTGIF